MPRFRARQREARIPGRMGAVAGPCTPPLAVPSRNADTALVERARPLDVEEDRVESLPLGQYYARKVGETQREIQRFERERRRLVRIEDHAFINLELPRGEDDEGEVARRAA